MALRDARDAAKREQEAGNAAVGRGDWAEAETRYTSSLALHATPAAHSNRAAARLALGRPGDAVADARAALALDASFVRAYIRLSAALRVLGDDAAALATAREGLALAERTGSPLASQLRDAAAAATASARPRFEKASAETRARFRTVCAHCTAVLSESRVCAECRQVSFCNEACQAAGWPAHRAACKVMKASMASAVADSGMEAMPRTSQAHALQNWILEHEMHNFALQALAWHVQHSPPARWGAPGAVMLSILRTTDDATLRVKLAPLGLMRRVQSIGHAEHDDVSTSAQTAGMVSVLSRVDIDVGYYVAVEDRRANSALSTGRVRYSLPRDMLTDLVARLLYDRQLRVAAATFEAEVDMASLLT